MAIQNFPLTSANIGLYTATLKINSSSGQCRFVFSGTYTGVTGTVMVSYTGAAGSYVPIQSLREDINGTFNNTVGASNFSVLFNTGGWLYVWFDLTAIASGTLNLGIDPAANAGLPLGGQTVNLTTVQSLITSTSSAAFEVGPNGATNPAFKIDCSAGSAATGLNLAAAAAASGFAVSVLSSGTNENLTIDAKGSGTISLGSVSTGAIVLGQSATVAGTVTVTSASANALTVGLNGATNPAIEVDASTSSSATGLKLKSAAAAGGFAISVISSGTNENGKLDAKGSGSFTINGTATGNVILGGGGGIIVCPGTLTGGGLLTNAIQLGTSGPLIYSGSGAPTISAAVKGSLYLRSDGSSTSTRMYVAEDTAGTWAGVTTSA
jgi:hypothetical protein